MKQIVARKVKHYLKAAMIPSYREMKRLESLPRYTHATTSLLGHSLEIVDGPSFIGMYQEICQKEIYKIRFDGSAVRIIDGGANIGLSAIYLGQHYPDARLLAFEPDPAVFDVLSRNISSFGLHNVELINKALWSSETELTFTSEGADAGRLEGETQGSNTAKVKTVRLRDYLQERVAFLKLDIEGAETEVLQDCRDLLHNVDNIFVEYHSYAEKPQTIKVVIDILVEAGFRLHINNPADLTYSPLFERVVNHDLDLWLNIFGYRGTSQVRRMS